MFKEVEGYIDRVQSGKENVCLFIKQSVDRFIRDYQNTNFYFDVEKANKALTFFKYLRHSKGAGWSGKPFILSPWQQYIIVNIFGWVEPVTGYRRYRVVYIEVPRKNGKSTLAAGIGLKCLIYDGEPGGEIYCAATKKDQAQIVFQEAKRMVKKSPKLSTRIKILNNKLEVLNTDSIMSPLSKDFNSMDGLNSSCNIVDEVHAHKSRDLWDVLEEGTGARTQPLTLALTTAGTDILTLCGEQREYSQSILEGVIEDDAYFPFISTIDSDDDWRDEKVWMKANPNYGISVVPQVLKDRAKTATQFPSSQNAFRRFRLNEWTRQEDRWIDMQVWKDNPSSFTDDYLKGKKCWAGLDLSSTTDLTALVLVFPDTDCIIAKCFFWIPKDTLFERARKDKIPYPMWEQAGYIKATDGNIQDYNVIRRDIKALSKKYIIDELAIDRWNATQISTQLEDDGLEVIGFGQGFASMSAPTKELERLLLSKKVNHGGNPILAWCANNISIVEDDAENKKPTKTKSKFRIDGMVALIMALGRMLVKNKEMKPSIYNERGVIAV